jgi:hypothetical protein
LSGSSRTSLILLDNIIIAIFSVNQEWNRFYFIFVLRNICQIAAGAASSLLGNSRSSLILFDNIIITIFSVNQEWNRFYFIFVSK